MVVSVAVRVGVGVLAGASSVRAVRVFLVNLTDQEVKEALVVALGVIFRSLVLPARLLLPHLLLVHAEVDVEQPEGDHYEHDKEVDYFEGQVALSIDIVPLFLVLARVEHFVFL